MKKFCNKISKQQWRVTVPNLNTSFFRKSPSREENSDHSGSHKITKSTSSGSYDLQAAQKAFENGSVTNSVVADMNTSDSESEASYEDARATSEKLSTTDEADTLYTDIEYTQKVETSTTVSQCNDSQFEYDVPKISFSFFECEQWIKDREKQPEYEIVNVKVRQPLDGKSGQLEKIPEDGECKTTNNNCDAIEEESSEENCKKKVKTQVSIILASPNNEESTKEINEINDSSDLSLGASNSDPKRESVVETRTINLYLTKSLDNFYSTTLMRCGSEPNISHSKLDITVEDENFYKVPGTARSCRLSQSLDGFNLEDIDVVSSIHSSTEHISCSQVIVPKAKSEPNGTSSAQNSAGMDYCKARSKLPKHFRRVTFLRKPGHKAADTWLHLRTKINNMVAEHAAKQRVGAFAEKDKTNVNVEGMYRQSKNKCKKMLKNTGKIFSKTKKDQENVDPNTSETSSQIIKHDAFFAKVPLKASDIEYKLNDKNKGEGNSSGEISEKSDTRIVPFGSRMLLTLSRSLDDDRKEDFDFHSIKSAFRRSKHITEGQNGFDDLRRYVKQGSDFCKELSAILQERSEAELQYAKSLSKLSGKLARACREGVGALNEGWRSVAVELEARAEAHRILGTALAEDATRPLRNLTENQQKTRKHSETTVDKAAKSLSDWRSAEAKSKKHSHACARENEKLQDACLDVRLPRTTSLIQLAHMHSHKTMSEKENTKMEGKKKKAEDAVKKADIEYYTLCVRSERARLEWESAVSRGANTFQTLEEDRLNSLKSILSSYLHHNSELGPRLIEAVERLKNPVAQADPLKDASTFINLRNSSQQVAEQLLPDFYCEHITLAMNRERRKQALVKLLHLIRQDIERERKSKNGLENLSKAIKQTPNFGAEDSQQSVSEKLFHMKSMLTYLEGARYKLQSSLAELDSRPRSGHPLAAHITITRDKAGLQQSVLKVPQWLRDQWIEPETSPMSEKSEKSDHINDTDLPDPDWTDRGAGDGNSNQPDSDFDEFSSQGSSTGGLCNTEEIPVQPIEQCRALYVYTPNLPDELMLHPGDVLSVYRKQDDGWWLGECKGSVGIFPATYVETIVS